MVSGDAPAKGHQRNKLIMDTLAQFQVMPPQGGIHCGDYLVFLEDEFQVIPPRGDIPSSICLDIPTCSFKSFPREGGRSGRVRRPPWGG